MMQRDSSPTPFDNEEQMDDEDLVYVGDIDEVIEPSEIGGNEVDAEDVILDKGDAACVFTGHKFGSIFCGSLNKDGKLAATGSEEDKAYVWDTTTGDIVLDCTGHKDSIIFAEFNFDETYLATGDISGVIQVWEMNSKSPIWEYNMGDATWMKWHMAANILLAGSVEGEIYMWKIPTDSCKVVQSFGSKVETASIFPDGKRIAVGYEDGAIRTIDLKTCSVLSVIPSNIGHSTTITSLDCHIDNNLILSAAVDGKTILSTSHTGKIVSILQNLNNSKKNYIANSEEETESTAMDMDSNWVETVAFCKNPEFQVAATGTLNGEIFIWDIAKKVLRHKMEQEGGQSKVLWKGTTTILFSAGLDGILRCYDAKTSQCIRTFTGHAADILDLYISEDGKTALTASDDSTARIFDISAFS